VNAVESLEKLKKGNSRYLVSTNRIGDISKEIRQKTAINGQHSFAIIVACSDSREIPEAVFSCGIGELFTIRVAGNVVDESVIGSIEYAADNLGCPLTVVLGHTHCGAVVSAMSGGTEGYTKKITDKISEAIGNETDEHRAVCLNIKRTVEVIRASFRKHSRLSSMKVIGALYDIETGVVEF